MRKNITYGRTLTGSMVHVIAMSGASLLCNGTKQTDPMTWFVATDEKEPPMLCNLCSRILGLGHYRRKSCAD